MSHSSQNKKQSKFMTKIRKHNDIYIGLDVHKSTIAVAAFSSRYGLIASMSMPSDNDALVRLLTPHKSGIENIVYEAGPTGFGLVRALWAAEFDAFVVSPGSIPRKPNGESKTDSIDCRNLAQYAARGMLDAVSVPTERKEAHRQILRMRNTARKDLTRIMCRIKMFLLRNGIEYPEGLSKWTNASMHALKTLELPDDMRYCLDMQLLEYSFYKKHLSQYESKLRALLKLDDIRDTARRLNKIDGVGMLTALTFILEIVFPDRFENERQLGRYIGLSPRLNQTGNTCVHLGLTQSGNRRLRHALIEAAWRWKRTDPRAHRLYRHYLKRTGRPQKAICALARKLGIIMWRMCVTGDNYRAIA